MSKVSVYLNFPDKTEYYKSIFGGQFVGGIMRLGETPPQPDRPPLSEAEKNLVMHVDLELFPGFHLMGTDAPESMGFKITMGNNISISLEPDTREEAKRLFTALSKGGKVTMPLEDMFWGAYYGDCTDKYGVQWMVNVANSKPKK